MKQEYKKKIHPSSSTIISRRSLARRFSPPSCSDRNPYLGVSYPSASSPSSSRRNSLNEARADISPSRIPIRSPSGDGYAAGVDGIESGVSACAGVDGVGDRPGSECPYCVLGDAVGSNGSSGSDCCRCTPMMRSRSTHLQCQSEINTSKLATTTYESARSRLSFTTPVTPRIISKLSVASVKICWAARFAPLAVGRPILAREEASGDGARDDTGVPDRDRSGPPALRSLRCRPVRRLLPAPPADAPAAELAPGVPSGIPWGVVAFAALAQRRGRWRMKPRTRVRAGSGSALPAYLLTTSTTWRMVFTTSLRTSWSVRMCVGEI